MNPRQEAILFWMSVAFAFAMAMRDIRDSLLDAAKTAMSPQLSIPALVSLVWNAAVIYGLYLSGFWSVSLWWDTAVFVVIGTTRLIFRMADTKDYSNWFFLKVAGASLGFSVIFGTFVDTYTFALWVELLLVPWLVALVGLITVAESSVQYSAVRRLLRFLVAVTVLAMVSRAVAGAVANYRGFLSLQTVRSLTLLFVLTAAYLPYLFGLRIWMRYQLACVPLKLGEDKSLVVFWYAAVRMVIRFRFNLSRLDRFRAGPGGDLRFATTRQAVDEVFAQSK